MTPTTEILDSTWAGTRIGDMTRDELILAFWQAAELLQSSMDSHRSTLEAWALAQKRSQLLTNSQ